MELGRCAIYLLLTNFLVCLCQVSSSEVFHYGVLAAESSKDKENFCIIYFPEFSEVPNAKSKAESHIVQDESSMDLCVETTGKDFANKIILANRSSCNLVEQAKVVQQFGGIGAVFIASDDREENEVNDTSTDNVNITVALISQNSFDRLMGMQAPVYAKLFSPYEINFDYSLLVIWIVAMFTISTGSYWSGMIRQKLHYEEISKLPELNLGNSSGSSTIVKPGRQQLQEESSLNISPLAVGVFVLCMSATLLLLYFFFDYLVYFLIGLFVIVGINSVYICFYPIVSRIIPHFVLIEIHLRDTIRKFDIRHLLLICMAVALPISWVITRKESYSWILQDILGVLFCINMLITIRLPNLKICTVLLVLLFFYDIFFVFITPFLTAKGGSIMEEVATGGQSKEKLPMMLKVPRFNLNSLAVCYQQFSLLGFGDILVPGLLISFCHSFDLITNGRRLYFLITISTYGIGLIFTFVAVYFMATAQPALLYLVPCTLLPVMILGWCQGTLKSMWHGFKNCMGRVAVIETVSEPSVATDVDPAASIESATNTQMPTTVSSDLVSPEKNPQKTNESVNERKHLLQ